MSVYNKHTFMCVQARQPLTQRVLGRMREELLARLVEAKVKDSMFQALFVDVNASPQHGGPVSDAKQARSETPPAPAQPKIYSETRLGRGWGVPARAV